MDYITQDSSIVVLLGLIVKFGGGIGEVSETLVLFLRHVIEKAVIIRI